MAIAEKSESSKVFTPDELDLEIVAIYASTKNCTLKIASEKTGVCIATIWNRLQAIRKCDWFADATARAQSLADKAIDRIEKELDENTNEQGHSVAVSLLRGVRVLADKSEVDTRSIPNNAHEFLESFKRMPIDEKRAVIEGLASSDAVAS